MLEYFSYKKFKKHQANKAAQEDAAATTAGTHPTSQTSDGIPRDHSPPATPLHPVLEPEDESFLEHLLSDDGPAPALPPRPGPAEWQLDWSSDSDSDLGQETRVAKDATSREKPSTAPKEESSKAKPGRWSSIFSKDKRSEAEVPPAKEGLQPKGVSTKEGEREKNDLSHVLSRLNLAAKNNKVMSYSNESSQLLQRFTLVFKDLVNGVPTAYDDLTTLIEDRDGTISKGFDKLPSSMKKMVTHLPDKLTMSLAPEILAAAAESQGLKASSEAGAKAAAKGLLTPGNLYKLVTKPGALVAMLRTIVEALKARWPAFLGMNVLWSVALSLLLFLLWYCHKRGRETRLDREKSESAIDGADRVEELPDDPALPAPQPASASRGDAGVPSITTGAPLDSGSPAKPK